MRQNRWMRVISQRYELVILGFVVAYFLIISAINPSFLSLETVKRIAYNGVQLSLVTLGVSIVIITKNIDVSLGSLVGLAATLGGASINASMNVPIFLGVCLGTGILGGLFNGIGVAYMGVSPIIMTLGTMAIFRGMIIMYTGGRWIQTIPNFYLRYMRYSILGVPIPIWITFVILFIMILIFNRTRFGRLFYAVGNNAEGANLQGMPVQKITVMAYVISGFMAGLAAAIYVGQIGAVPNMVGVGLETQAIAAAVIGGVSLAGGKGTVVGAYLGSLLLQTINYSLVFLKVPGYWNDAISGFMLLVIIVFSALLHNYMQQQKQRDLYRRMGLVETGAIGHELKEGVGQ